ncbi:MAG: inositol monophosphatase family protein, partial [Natronospirillum sp.]
TDTVQPLQTTILPADIKHWQTLHSRSHQSSKTRYFKSILGVPDENWSAVGSSIKMCHVAQGKAHLYARLGPTSEWDTGAAQIILEEAGGLLLNAKTRQPLTYNTKESLINPWFVAVSGFDARWETAIASTITWAQQRSLQ